MFEHVVKSLLRDPVQIGLDVAGYSWLAVVWRTDRLEFRVDPVLLRPFADECLYCVIEAQRIQFRRAQFTGEEANISVHSRGDVPDRLDLIVCDAILRNHVEKALYLEPQSRQHLTDMIVEVSGDPFAFGLLHLDHAVHDLRFANGRLDALMLSYISRDL